MGLSRVGKYSVSNLSRRLGLRGSIVRYGEEWATEEIKALKSDIMALSRKHFSHVAVEDIETDAELRRDIIHMLEHHGPALWPVPDPSKHNDRCWLFTAPDRDAPEYTVDLVYPLNRDVIEPTFIDLMLRKYCNYRNNRNADGVCLNSAKARQKGRTPCAYRHTRSPSSDLTEYTTETEEHEGDPDSVLALSIRNPKKEHVNEFGVAHQTERRASSSNKPYVPRDHLEEQSQAGQIGNLINGQEKRSTSLVMVLRVHSDKLRALATGYSISPLTVTTQTNTAHRSIRSSRKRPLTVVTMAEMEDETDGFNAKRLRRSNDNLPVIPPELESPLLGRDEAPKESVQPSQHGLRAQQARDVRDCDAASLSADVSLSSHIGPKGISDQVRNDGHPVIDFSNLLHHTSAMGERRVVLRCNEDFKSIKNDDDEMVYLETRKVERPHSTWIDTPPDSRRASSVAQNSMQHVGGSRWAPQSAISSQDRRTSLASVHNTLHGYDAAAVMDGQECIWPPLSPMTSVPDQRQTSSLYQHTPLLPAVNVPHTEPMNDLQRRLARTTLSIKSYDGKHTQVEPAAFTACRSAEEVRRVLMKYLVQCIGWSTVKESKRLRAILYRIGEDRKKIEEHEYRIPLQEDYFVDGWEIVTDELMMLPAVTGRGSFMLLVTALKEGQE